MKANEIKSRKKQKSNRVQRLKVYIVMFGFFLLALSVGLNLYLFVRVVKMERKMKQLYSMETIQMFAKEDMILGGK